MLEAPHKARGKRHHRRLSRAVEQCPAGDRPPRIHPGQPLKTFEGKCKIISRLGQWNRGSTRSLCPHWGHRLSFEGCDGELGWARPCHQRYDLAPRERRACEILDRVGQAQGQPPTAAPASLIDLTMSARKSKAPRR